MTSPIVPRSPPRVPIFNVPPVIVAMAVLLASVHIARQLLPEEAGFWVVRQFAFVPARITMFVAPGAIARRLIALATDPKAGDQLELFHVLVAHGGVKLWTVFTYALLHGNFAHLAMNTLWLVAFGAPVARRFGTWRFVVFLAVSSVAGVLAQTIAHPLDFAPIIGASAAVSGAVGAALRFVFQPGESLGQGAGSPEEGERAAPSAPLGLAAMSRNRQVVSFVGAWFVLNFLFGILALPLGLTDQAIAWEAHIGGFLAGLLLFGLFDPVGRR